jgi:hypothetical protein
MSDSPSRGRDAVSINGSAANLAAGSTLPLFAAEKLLRILTERFFLYRFVVFCPEKTNASIASENLEK